MSKKVDSGQPWLRLPTDTDKSFEAFVIFRDMGPTRALEKVARKLGKTGQLVGRWSQLHDWRTRIHAYDQDQDRQWRDQVDGERSIVARRHARMLQDIQSKGVAALRALPVGALSAGDVLRYLTEAMKLEGVIYGLGAESDGPSPVTIIVDGNVTPPATVIPERL